MIARIPCAPSLPRSRATQSGVALAIVVWFIAGMSLLVAGIVAQARVDTQLAQIHADRARVTAAADGAIRLFIAELSDRSSRDARRDRGMNKAYRIGSTEVILSATPSDALISLENAPEKLLAQLFVLSGTANPGDAAALAGSVVDWRKTKFRGGGENRFETVEDLLRVPGVNRGQYDVLRDFVVAGPGASAYPRMTPFTPQLISQVMRRVQPGQGARNRSNDNASLATSDSLRVDAIIETGGRRWIRRHWVESGGDSTSVLSWQAKKVEPPRVLHDRYGAGNWG